MSSVFSINYSGEFSCEKLVLDQSLAVQQKNSIGSGQVLVSRLEWSVQGRLFIPSEIG